MASATTAGTTDDLSKQFDNSLASLISASFQNNFDFKARDNKNDPAFSVSL